MNAKVRKAVFPAAGRGTRLLPATKAQPKEMLPIVDKPIIQYGVEEAIQSGIQNIIIVTGRGKTAIGTWRLADSHPDPPLTRAGKVNADAFWERITYFLERIIPVAAENKIRMACHPHDPGVPPEGYQGVTRVLGTVDGLKKFLAIEESPYHGLNFCQGTVSEML